MMQMIRSSAGKFMTIIIVGGFLAWMVYGIGMEVTGASSGPGELGSVNGTPISLEAYQNRVQQLQQQLQQQGQTRLTPEQQKQLEQRAWDDLVNEILVSQEMARRGIGVSDDEIRFAALNVPAPELARQEIFQTNGQFDPAKYRAYLSGPQASDEVLAQLEGYYRSEIPRSKLFNQIAAGIHVSDQELWRGYQDRTETATVEYVALHLNRLAPGNVNVTDAEIRRYYDEHQDEYERPRTARLAVAILPIAPTAADRAATLQRAERLRAEIAGGADFAAVAKRESQDPGSAENGGDLGTVSKGQMVEAFDSAVFSLPVGELSQPVETQFGYHLIQVTERTGETAKARHILLPVRKSDEELARLDARADSLESIAERLGIERAARTVGAALRQGVTVSDALPYIPGVGPAIEALDWAAAASRDEDLGPHRTSEVFEGENAYYVVQLKSYTPKGMMTVAEATPAIREALILQKKREKARAEGQKIVAEVRSGRKSLQQAAAGRGLAVETVGPFTRVEPNPAFGQATAPIGAAFGTPVGQVSDVAEAISGLYIIRPTARTQANRAEFQRTKGQMRAMMEMQLRQQAAERWLDSARKAAEIKDNRGRVFGNA